MNGSNRQHCRNHLLKVQTYYTNYTSNKRKPKDIKINLRVYAKIDKHRQLPKNKLDLPVSGPFKVISQKGTLETPRVIHQQKLHRTP